MIHAPERARFLHDYLRIRRAEGRGSDDPRYYLELPYRDITGNLTAQWEMRGRTYRYFEQRILPAIERAAARSLRILDLGAGTCWMSYRLALHGHHPAAIDLLSDPHDGLGAARHFFPKLGRAFIRAEAQFDELPFPDASFDLAIFNASLHYSADYARTLGEARRCLHPQGRIVILDSPVYRFAEHGERMRRERHQQFVAAYGTASDHIQSIEYLDPATIDSLAASIGIEWRIHKPWYGWAWHMRPWKARWKGARPPSRFWILEGRLTPR